MCAREIQRPTLFRHWLFTERIGALCLDCVCSLKRQGSHYKAISVLVETMRSYSQVNLHLHAINQHFYAYTYHLVL